MATIYKRVNKDGTIAYRVTFRKTGLKSWSTTFVTRKEAEKFAEDYEPYYVFNHDEFMLDMSHTRCKKNWKRKFQYQQLKKENSSGK